MMLAPGQINKFILDEGIVLQSSGTTGIYFLDAAASYYYCIAEKCTSDTDVLATVEKELGSATEGLTYARRLIAQWRELGLLPGLDESRRRRRDISPKLPKLCTPEPLPVPGDDHALRFTILGKPIRVSCSSADISPAIAAAFAHLVSPPRQSDSVQGFSFKLRRLGTDMVLTGHGREWWRGPKAEAVPALKAVIFSVTVDASPYLASIHAAGLAHGESCFLLAGGSGSGKTLLSLALVKNGYSYLSDDCVLIDRKFSAFGVPMPISIKRSGIEVARKITPGIDQLCEHLRYDGHWVRYWTPVDSLEQRKVAMNAVFFIRHNREGANQIEPLSVFAGLKRFAELLQIRRPLRSAELSALVAWGKKTKFIELDFSNHTFAMSSIASI